MSTKHDWTTEEIDALFTLPFNDLLFKAHSTHRAHFDPNEVQISTLLSIKTGACAEDCKYCSQSAQNDTSLERERLLPLEQVLTKAREAKAAGSTRFCMGAAWRNPTDKNLDKVIDMIQGVKGLGMEACVTLGMLTDAQAKRLGDAGLDYYNHNIDTSPEYYNDIISTRTFQERLDTLESVRNAGVNVCSGGIMGMGESRKDRISFLQQLANLPTHPQSVPINQLVKIDGTPLADTPDLEPFEFVRTIAVARVMMPQSHVRLSAGRTEMNEQMQAMCFFAGANSIFYGEKLLTADNPAENKDTQLFEKLGIRSLVPEGYHEHTPPIEHTVHFEAFDAQV